MVQKLHITVRACLNLSNICYFVQHALNIYIETLLILHYSYIEMISSEQSPKQNIGLKICMSFSFLIFYCCYLEIVIWYYLFYFVSYSIY